MFTSMTSALRARGLARPALAAFVVAAIFAGPASGSSYSISYGGSVTAVTTASGEKATLTFAGTAGDRVSMRISGVTMSPYATTGDYASLKFGSTVVVPAFAFGRNGTWMEPVTLPSTGTYTILLDPQSTYTGRATVQIWKTPADVTQAATENGGPVTLAMTTPGQNGTVTFPGTSGDRVSLKFSGVTIGTSTTNSAAVTVKNPDASALVPGFNMGTSGSFVEPVTLAQTGTYTIKVDPKTYNAGSATVTVYLVPADQTPSISVGTQLPLTFASPGQNATVTISGLSAGQRMALNISSDTIGTGTAGTNVTIYNGASVLVATAAVGLPGKFFEPITLPAGGPYTVKIDPQGFNVGSMNLDLYGPVPANSSTALGALGSGGLATSFSVGASSAGQNGTFTFTGTLNQRVAINFSSVTIGTLLAGSNVTVTGPNGKLVPTFAVGTNGYFMDTIALPAAGTYTITVDPTGANTGSMNINVYQVAANTTTATTAAASPTPVTVTNTSPGQNMNVTFTGALNQRIFVDLTNVSIGTSAISGTQVSLIRPNGTALGTTLNVGTNGGYVDAITLPAAGTYTVKINPTGANTGSMTVAVYVVPADSTGAIATNGTTSSLSLTVPGQNFTRTFTAVANHYYSLDMTSIAFGASLGQGAKVTIYGPSPATTQLVIGPFNSKVISVGTAGAFMEPIKITTAGTYTVKVDPVGDYTGSGNFQLYDLGTSNVVNGGAIALNTAAYTPATTMPGQNVTGTYTATLGPNETDTFSADPGNVCTVQITVPGATTNGVAVTNYQLPPGASMPITFPTNTAYTFTIDYLNTYNVSTLNDCYGTETLALSNP
jgi:hypothetical protein